MGCGRILSRHPAHVVMPCAAQLPTGWRSACGHRTRAPSSGGAAATAPRESPGCNPCPAQAAGTHKAHPQPVRAADATRPGLALLLRVAPGTGPVTIPRVSISLVGVMRCRHEPGVPCPCTWRILASASLGATWRFSIVARLLRRSLHVRRHDLRRDLRRESSNSS